MFGIEFDLLVPAEQLLWNAYYSLEPFGGELQYLAQIEAGTKNLRKPVLPPECELNVPFEDLDQSKLERQAKEQMNELAKAALADWGMDFDALVKEAGWQAELAKQGNLNQQVVQGTRTVGQN